MNVTLGGKTYNIKNGGQIVLGDGYAVEIYVDPFPPSTLRTWMDLYLTLNDEPVSDAVVDASRDTPGVGVVPRFEGRLVPVPRLVI